MRLAAAAFKLRCMCVTLPVPRLMQNDPPSVAAE